MEMRRILKRGIAWVVLGFFVPSLALAAGRGQWLRKEVRGLAPDLTLTDQDGRRLSLKALRGKVVLMNFIHTQCPDACPLLTAKLKEIQKALEGKGLHILTVSIDPDNDPPRAMKEYAKRFGADLSSWSFLTGMREESVGVLAAYQVPPLPLFRRKLGAPDGEVDRIIDHDFRVFIIDRKGIKRFEYWGEDLETRTVMKDLKRILAEPP